MDSKPIISFAGDEKLFESLKNGIIDGLPQESVEWRRSHMRNPKPVYVTANFTPFSDDILPKEGNKGLRGQSFFHTYWTECSDIDLYKSSVKDDINAWLLKLKTAKVYDWLVIVVEHVDNKKTNKTKLLPRTTVIDKVKNDFPSQGSQRSISLLDPCRSDSRAAESWQLLLQRIRKLVLQAYSRQLSQFEEHMRTQRERRTEQGWNFQDFFFLQEELAFVLEMLGLYDEALVQYDELDALFTQFVINSNVGDMPDWLTNYSRSCDLWSGVCLLKDKASAIRDVMLGGEAALLDLRNYLFTRQCALLLLLCRPWEIAQRTLPFLHNCISELKILEIPVPVGAVACWVFLSSLEVLQTCEKFSDTSQIKAYSLYTAGLWAYAREKLHELGLLCGLMPDQTAASEQLHLVVSLLSGMGSDPYPETSNVSPHTKLREALSSKESFLKHYMELSELTMGTFKHNRRIRTARFIGRDLAKLYMKLKQPQKAASFLSDLLKTYKEENWDLLVVQTQKDLLKCFEEMGDVQKYLRTCLRLSASPLLDLAARQSYFQSILSCSSKLGSDTLLLRTEKIFQVDNACVCPLDPSFMSIVSNSDVRISFNIRSFVPEAIICRHIKISLKCEAAASTEASNSGSSKNQLSPNRKTGMDASRSPMSPMQSGGLGIPSREDMPPSVHIQPHMVTNFYYQVDGTITYGVVCKNTHQITQRRDSHLFPKEKELAEDDTGMMFKKSDVKIEPGKNVISITVKIPDPGVYTFSHMWIEWGNIHFVLSNLPSPCVFAVIEELPFVTLKEEKGELLAGIEQPLILVVSSGSSSVPCGTNITLKSSKGLKLKNAQMNEELSESTVIPLPEIKPFQTINLPLIALAHFVPQKNANTMEHRVSIVCLWADTPYQVPLHFLPPFLLTNKLHTCGVRKYVQVTAHGMTPSQFVFQKSRLESPEPADVNLKPLNLNQSLIVNVEQSACFLWEILNENGDLPNRFVFSSNYMLKDATADQVHHCEFDFRMSNYQTLYSVRARVEPPKGSEFCRAGIMCYMHISINQIAHSIHASLMYEVVAEQSMWAVCGRTAGVVNIDGSGKHSVTLDVMPLIGGFLPLPTVRLSKYIPAEQHKLPNKDSTPSKESCSHNVARLEPFDQGQVYSWSRALQVHVLPGPNAATADLTS